MTTTLINDGYLLESANEIRQRVPALFTGAFKKAATREAAALEPDHANGQFGRYRRHAKALLFTDTKEIRFLNPKNGRVIYNQGAYNPEHSHTLRPFFALSRAFLKQPALSQLVLYDFEHTNWRDYDLSFPLCVGLSIIKFQISADAPAGTAVSATPDALHQDGEVYTFAHLLERRNAEGGDNVISLPGLAGERPSRLHSKDVKAHFFLKSYLDSYAIFDPLVSHHVNRISRKIEWRSAVRTILLIDFTPMKLIHQ